MKKALLFLFCSLFFYGISVSQIVPDDEIILEQMEINHVPGLSAVVIIDDSVYWNGNYGYMNLEDSIPVHDSTLFTAFSIGKTVTTACLMHLWDNQAFGLDQNMNDFIPFQVTNPYNSVDSITPRMLMSHTSSIRDYNESAYIVIGDPTESLASIQENYLRVGGSHYTTSNFWNIIPGTYYYYATAGTGQLGYLLEPLTGIDFRQYAKDSLFTPLEMNSSAWFLSELNLVDLATGYTYGGGNFTVYPHVGLACYPGFSLRSTALELANFNICLLNSGMYNGTQLLSEDAVDSMITVQDPSFSGWFGPTGLGVYKTDHFGVRDVWGHYGGGDYGFAGHFFFCPDENTAVVVLSNSEQWLDNLVEYLFDFALSVMTEVPEYDKNELPAISIYPNPASETIRVNCFTDIHEIRVYSLNGKELRCFAHDGVINISNLSPGIYILEARTEGEVVRRKFVKK